jgi:NitT/TauT family transport system substrate-binding protein
MRKPLTLVAGALVALAIAIAAAPAAAEFAKVRIGKQLGLSYLPLLVAQHDKLIEKHAKLLGLDDLEVEWQQLGSAAALNDAILSSSSDFVAGACTVSTVLWDKTRGNLDVRGVVALGNFDYALNTNDPNIRSVRDFTDKDRIAVSGVKLSVHAILLQMAAAKEFGASQWDQLDRLTVSLPHPEGLAALLAHQSGITAHLTSPPFQDLELRDKSIHRVFAASDILGDGGPTLLVWASAKVRNGNPKVAQAIVDAVKEAVALINRDFRRTAGIYVEIEKPNLSVEDVTAIISNPAHAYTTQPKNMLQFARFMHGVGTIKNLPGSWRDLFFPEGAGGEGS